MEILEVGLKEMRDNPNLIYVYWYLTGACNYECDYCDVYNNDKFEDWNIKESIVDYLNWLGSKKICKPLIYGGEPTMDQDLPRILKILKDSPRLFTNLSRDLDYWKELTNVRQDMTISASYHIHKCKQEAFVEKVSWLMSNTDVKVRVKIMADSRFKEETINIYKDFKKLYDNPRYECYLDIVYPNSVGDIGAEWIEKDLDWFLPEQRYKTLYLRYKEGGEEKEKETSWNEMRTQMIETNHYYQCMAGVNLLYIKSNGDVCLCKSRLGTPIFNTAYVWKIPQEGIVCDYMGFCCETEYPKKLVCRRKVSAETKNIKNLLR